MEKREFSPMIGQKPNPNKIKCRTCAFRDMTVITLDQKTIPVGITKSKCEMFEAKPRAILFQNADCEFYVKEKTNG